MLTHIGSEAVIIMPGGKAVRGRDGTVLVYGGGIDLTAPEVQNGVAYMANSNESWGGGAWAVKLPAQVPDAAIKPEIIWKNASLHHGHYYASPIIHDGLVYAAWGCRATHGHG